MNAALRLALVLLPFSSVAITVVVAETYSALLIARTQYLSINMPDFTLMVLDNVRATLVGRIIEPGDPLVRHAQ